MNEIQAAQLEVEQSRHRVEEAFRLLEDKLRLSTLRVQNTVYKLRAPERLVQRNPLIAAATFAALGFFVGSRLAKRGSSRQIGFKRSRPAHGAPAGTYPSRVIEDFYTYDYEESSSTLARPAFDRVTNGHRVDADE